MSRRAYVYRAYDADDRLLYIGSTIELAARLRAHQRHSPWYMFTTSISLEPFDSLAEAREAETKAIGSEHPRWNVTDRSPDHPDGVIHHGRGKFKAPWLRDEIRQWRESRKSQTSAPRMVPLVRGAENQPRQPRFITAAEWQAKYGAKAGAR